MLALKLLQLQAKYEMSNKIKMQQKTEHLAFHKNFFKQRLKHGSEFDLNNKRYDVVNAAYVDDSVFVDAINDKREKGILHHIGKLMHQQNKQHKDPSKVSSLSMLLFQAPLPDKIDFVLPFRDLSTNYFSPNFLISTVCTAIITPPPRQV
jgi:hypothetical protein